MWPNEFYFFNRVLLGVHTLLPSVLQCLNIIGQKKSSTAGISFSMHFCIYGWHVACCNGFKAYLAGQFTDVMSSIFIGQSIKLIFLQELVSFKNKTTQETLYYISNNLSLYTDEYERFDYQQQHPTEMCR